MANLHDPTVMEAPATGRRGNACEHRGCFHCGEPCPDNHFGAAGKVFCCQGCQLVHDLLNESGLGQFYRLSEAPGVRIRGATRREHWAYLDEPALQQRLLDFTDGRRSRVTFHVPAIHCIACVWLLENLFRLHPGIGSSQVNFPRREVAIAFAAEQIKLSELVALLASIGYEPVLTLGELEKAPANPARRRQWLQVGVAGFAFGNIMLISLPVYLGLDSMSGPVFRALFGWLSLALALPVLIYSAADYWKSALLSLRQRVLTLDVPIALGLAALYAQSGYAILSRTGEGYLDSLTGLVFFLLCGRVFQQKTHERILFERDFRSFFPLSVTRTAGGTEERVAISSLRVGDRLLLRHGELIPADARLISGPAFVDYSFVTGESEPVERREGDYLYAGGRQIGSAIVVETVKPISQSYLTSLWNHEAFQKHREDNLNTLTNRYSRRFTVIVIAVALGAAAFWLASGQAARAIQAFTSVLIVACPCALALAAPFTLGTAQRLLARMQVFLKNTLVVERMAKVDVIVFDKTGTLTAAGANAVKFFAGRRRSEESLSEDRKEGQNLLAPAAVDGQDEALTPAEECWLYSLTRHSTHPHAVRISDSLAERSYPEPVRSFLETPGCGIEGQVQGHEIWVGSAKWLEERGAFRSKDWRPAPPVGSVVYAAIDGRYRGAFVLSSVLRPQIDQLIRQLPSQYEIALLSGDNERERESLCRLFGSGAALHFNQTPLDKLGFIHRLQESGQTVMMVGDGLNDAGALKQSDVGVAVVEAAGAFSPASDVILEGAQVPRLAAVLAFARRAAGIVRLSFAISALYNAVGVTIAAAGLLSPLICAVLMPVSSVSVVLFACGMTHWAARRKGLEVDVGQAIPSSHSARSAPPVEST